MFVFFFNSFITWSGHNYHIDKNLMYKTKPMGASSSFILHTAKHVFIDHMLSYALWQLGAQPHLSFHHHLCCLRSAGRQAGRQVSSCLPHLPCASSALLGLHTVPHTPILTSYASCSPGLSHPPSAGPPAAPPLFHGPVTFTDIPGPSIATVCGRS